MSSDFDIREERPADIDAIRDVTVSAFKTPEASSHTEQYIVEAPQGPWQGRWSRKSMAGWWGTSLSRR
jgi:hypothetical protein